MKSNVIRDPINSRRLFAAFLTCVLAFFVGSAASADNNSNKQENAVALVIGNWDYKSAQFRGLTNVPNSIAKLQEALKILGYSVTKGENLKKYEQLDMFMNFLEHSKNAKRRIIFYTGHSVEWKGKNYLIPVGEEIGNVEELPDKANDISTWIKLINDVKGGFNLVILDACRTNPFLKKKGNKRGTGSLETGKGPASIGPPNGTLIAFSSGPGQLARDSWEPDDPLKPKDEEQAKLSPYVGRLLDNIKVPGLRIEQMFKQVRAQVMVMTGDTQTPWETTSLYGDFCIAGGCGN